MSITSKLYPTLKLGAKVGLVGAAVYYSTTVGLWRTDTSQSVMAFRNFSEKVDDTLGGEYLTKIGLPSSNRLITSWNSGVDTVFDKAADLPEIVSHNYEKAKDYINERIQ